MESECTRHDAKAVSFLSFWPEAHTVSKGPTAAHATRTPRSAIVGWLAVSYTLGRTLRL